jgi:threonine aldolase
MKGVEVDAAAVETNIVIFDISGTGKPRSALLEKLAPAGVRFSTPPKPTQFRAVTHLDIPADGVDRALAAVRQALA